MNSPKIAMERAPRFASNIEVFQYTAEQTTNQDDSLLLTPGCEDVIKDRSSVGPKEELIVDSDELKIRKEREEFNIKKQKKREEFLRRLSRKVPSFEDSDQEENKPY